MLGNRRAVTDSAVSGMLVACALTLVGLLGLVLTVIAAARRQAACGYGAVPMMVTEQDSRTHIVCGCPRGSR